MKKELFGRCPFDLDEDVKKIAAINKYIHAKFEEHKNKIDNLKGVEQKLMVLQYFNVLNELSGFAPIFPDTCYHLTHYWLAAVDIPVASDNPVHYADAIRYNARTPLQGSLLPLTRLVWA